MHIHVSLSLTSVIVWIGDLNYRITELDVTTVKELISQKDFETLHGHDQVNVVLFSLRSRVYESLYLPAATRPQLKRQMDEEAVFVGFVEGPIDFQPTYKYDTGSDKWDTR